MFVLWIKIVPQCLLNDIICLNKGECVPIDAFDKDIEVKSDAQPVRSMSFKITLSWQDLITVYCSFPFHIVFIELENED